MESVALSDNSTLTAPRDMRKQTAKSKGGFVGLWRSTCHSFEVRIKLNSRGGDTFETRKRAIAKALHLEGRTTSRQTFWVFSGLFGLKILFSDVLRNVYCQPPRGFRVNTDSRQIVSFFYLFTAMSA